MTKKDLINQVHANADGATKKVVGEVVNAIFDEIFSSLSEGENVQIRNFGTFAVAHRAERMGRNPQTGKPMKIAAQKTVRFKPSKNFKEEIQ